jgi:hypothetical protein
MDEHAKARLLPALQGLLVGVGYRRGGVSLRPEQTGAKQTKGGKRTSQGQAETSSLLHGILLLFLD